MSSKRRNWLWIIFGVFMLLVCIGIGAVIATTAWVRQNLTIVDTTAGGATKEFDTVHAQFGGRPPLFEMRDGRPVYVAGEPPEMPSSTPVNNLHVMIWDPEEDRMMSIAIPFWLLRLKSGPIEFSSYASGWDDRRVNLTAEQIERHGPGIIGPGIMGRGIMGPGIMGPESRTCENMPRVSPQACRPAAGARSRPPWRRAGEVRRKGQTLADFAPQRNSEPHR